MGIPPSKEISLIMKLSPDRSAESVLRYEGYLQRLARATSLSFILDGARPKLSASAVVQEEELFVPLEGLIDIELEKARLRKEIDRISGALAGIRNKLNNKSFMEKMQNFEQALEKLEKSYAALS
jgi:valyl-tRNA synthetase